MSNNELNTEITPFELEINLIKQLIPQLNIKYQAKMSEIITIKLKERQILEKKTFRVTSIINYDFSKEKPNKNYLKTYLHDALVDVSANYFEKEGFKTYKEQYLFEIINNKPIKGHVDLVLSGIYFAEIKNYTSGIVNYDLFLHFIHQIMVYGKILDSKLAYLIINNPRKYKKVSIFEINLVGIENYLNKYLNEILLIQDYKENFKYKKPIE